MQKIYIILVNYNSLDHTLECIDSIHKNKLSAFQIILIDNASVNKPGPINGIHLIQMSENKGFAGANNIGITYALSQSDCSHIFLLNNDTTLDPHCLCSLLSMSLANPHHLYGSRLLSYYKRDRYDHVGGVWNHKTCSFDLLLHDSPKNEVLQKHQSIDYICGASIFAPRSIYEALGALDERYFLYFEEADWCFKAKKLGYSCQICYDAIVYHKGAASQTKASETLSYYLWRNRFLFIKTHFTRKQRLYLYLKPIAWQIFKLIIQSSIKALWPKTKKRVTRRRCLRASRRAIIDAFKANYGMGKF